MCFHSIFCAPFGYVVLGLPCIIERNYIQEKGRPYDDLLVSFFPNDLVDYAVANVITLSASISNFSDICRTFQAYSITGLTRTQKSERFKLLFKLHYHKIRFSCSGRAFAELIRYNDLVSSNSPNAILTPRYSATFVYFTSFSASNSVGGGQFETVGAQLWWRAHTMPEFCVQRVHV